VVVKNALAFLGALIGHFPSFSMQGMKKAAAERFL